MRLARPWIGLLGLALGACGNTPSPNSGDGGTIEQARSNLSRDPASGIAPATVRGAVDANNAFALDLYGRLLADPQVAGGNMLTSPISASLALTMSYAGANGQTATEMAKALHYGAAASAIFDGQNGLSQALDSRAATALDAGKLKATQNQQPAPSSDDFQLQVLNSVWGERTYPWARPFLDVMAKSYGAGIYLEDFENQPDPARLQINDWVATATADKIKDLLPQGSIDGATRMVLVNAIYLKLPWNDPFEVGKTTTGTFTKTGGATVSATFMKQQHEWPYVDDGEAQIVALPLIGNQISVVIALPHGDLAGYEASLVGGSPSALSIPTKQDSVILSLPKVAFTTDSFSLAKALKAMGMVTAFDPSSADFKGLCPNPPDHANLYVSDVLQKAMVAMQETGVEAAAATAVLVSGTGIPAQPVELVVNRPYVFAIVDGPTGAILFLGHVTDPTAH